MKNRLYSLLIIILFVPFSFISGCIDSPDTSSIAANTTLTPIHDSENPLSENPLIPQLPITVEIQNAQKNRMIEGTSPPRGDFWLVVDLTIQNTNVSEGFLLEREKISIYDSVHNTTIFPSPKHLELKNPWSQRSNLYTTVWFQEIIPINTSKRGEIVFIVEDTPDSYELVITSNNGDIIASEFINDIPIQPYNPLSPKEQVFFTSLAHMDFNSTLTHLKNPRDTIKFLQTFFTYKTHPGCIAYPLEEFFAKKSGDCKDYARFFSYTLSQHGYYSEIIRFRYFKDSMNENNSHVVSIFRDDDGNLYYQSNADIFGPVTSIEDVLEKEKVRMNARIGDYSVNPPGSTPASCSY